MHNRREEINRRVRRGSNFFLELTEFVEDLVTISESLERANSNLADSTDDLCLAVEECDWDIVQEVTNDVADSSERLEETTHFITSLAKRGVELLQDLKRKVKEIDLREKLNKS